MLSAKESMKYDEQREKQHVAQEEQRVGQLRDDFYEKHPVMHTVEDSYESLPVGQTTVSTFSPDEIRIYTRDRFSR